MKINKDGGTLKKTDEAFSAWLDTLLDEKGVDLEETFTFLDFRGSHNIMPYGVVVEAMHDKLRRAMPIDGVVMCAHRQDEGCDCRKPRPGMFLNAAKTWKIDLKRSFMVGDRWGDVVAGQAAGCYTIFINRSYKEPRLAKPDSCAKSLVSATRLILPLI